ncbi:MAG: hypothetical protein NBV77_07090 [Bacteroidia bacterium]|nr:hypothetical protein [Bacteroidia bacterium]
MSKSLNIILLVGLFALYGCEKDPTTNDEKTAFKSYSVYEGESLTSMQLTNEFTFKFNAQGLLVLRTNRSYFNGLLQGTWYSDFQYQDNTIVESRSSDMNMSVPYLRMFHLLNKDRLVVTDSIVVLSNSNNTVNHYTYENGHRIYNYLDDTMNSGSVFAWKGDNQTHEYLIVGLMGRQEIAAYEYGNKLNTIDFGDFWLDGEKSKNLPEKCTEPNYEYTYTYKIESDGFVSERITAVSSPGGAPYRYEKIVYHR